MITVTAATGQLGGLIVDAVLEKVSQNEVEVTVRSLEKAANLVEAGISVHQADYTDVESMVQAFANTDTLMFISGDAPIDARIAQHRNVIDAARQAGVKRVVYTSFLDARADSPFTYSAIHANTEAYLRESGLAWTILRPSGYAEFSLGNAQHALDTSVLATATGEARVSYITRYDIARAAAAVLVEPAHADKIYELTGPSAVSQPELVQILSKISGKDISFKAITFEQFEAALKSGGLPPFVVEAFVGLQKAIVQGSMAKVTDDVETLTGTPAEPFESFIQRSLE